MPSRNVAPYIEEAIDSALSQTLREIEVIVVDDSVNSTREVLARIAEQRADPRLKILNGPSRGVSAARNVGIKIARGRYIGMLDADDLWFPTKAEKHIAVMDADPSIGMTFSGHGFFEGMTGSAMPKNPEPTLYDMIRANQMAASSVIIRRECFTTAGLFNEQLVGCEDWEMWCRIMHDTKLRAVLIPEILICCRIRPSSAMHQFSNVARGIEDAVASVRRKMPEVVSPVINEGHGEHYRNLVWSAISTGHRWVATRYLINAIYHYFPWSIARKSAVIASLIAAIVMPHPIFAKIQRFRGRAI